MNRKILIIVAEDDDEIAAILAGYLHKVEMETLRARDGKEAINLALRNRSDLMLLDINMPICDGWNVLATLRKETNVPIIMVTAFDQDIDKIMGLRLGADDYVIKPFNPSEVIARIEAVLRRTKNKTEVSYSQPLKTPSLTIYPNEFYVEVTTTSKVVTPALTTTEFKLLVQLARYPRKVFSRDELLDACLPEGDSLERTVDSHISKLRKKLEQAGLKGVPESIRGMGYRLGENK